MAKRLSVPTETLSADTKQLFDLINQESDLAVILIGTSFVDACLVSLLEKKLLKGSTADRLLNPGGALGSFRPRADLCYVLGLIPKSWYDDLRIIMEIQNKVAHNHLNLNFDDTEVSEKCAILSDPWEVHSENSSSRSRFTICVVMLSNCLLLDALKLESQGPVTAKKEPKIS